ncbi:DNA-binding response regulator [Achromobacter denitrificans]|uniref:response regulator transcription factor n=1 Tax=Achromobacter denitrificans TaxID=32002 RepID=UPI000B4D31E6|nr:response regulator transcription factor [Achromobacter denitrificans]ASC66123.1 DNA-binding response regulator [Achromobacter denitrificans]
MPVLLIADDHPLFRAALRGVIDDVLPGSDVHEADRTSTLYELADAHPGADLLLLDLDMPGAVGLDPLIRLRERHPRLPIAIVSANEDPLLMRRARALGVAGYLPKSVGADTLGAAILHLLDGGAWHPEAGCGAGRPGGLEPAFAASVRELTPQQFRVLRMVSAGLLNKQIAHELEVSEATVKAHMTAIMRKLRVSNRTQAVVIADRLGLKAWRGGSPP